LHFADLGSLESRDSHIEYIFYLVYIIVLSNILILVLDHKTFLTVGFNSLRCEIIHQDQALDVMI